MSLLENLKSCFVAIVCVILTLGFIQIIILAFAAAKCVYYHKFCPEVDFQSRYGKGTWVIITGGSSGQGKRFALEFASRGFNILLIGSKRSFDVQKLIINDYPMVKCKVILKDFTKSWEPNFFDDIKSELYSLEKGSISFLINNVGHRVAFRPHHRMPEELIYHTIACGTVVQALMTRICLPLLLEHGKSGLRSGLLSITAQCMHPNIGFGIAMQNDLHLPFLAPYEASNAFGFFHANSIYHEYKKRDDNNIDMLVITPGAVITPNTSSVLSGTIAAVDHEEFVSNIMRLIGNVEGVWSGSLKQGLSLWMVGIFPPMKDRILYATGKKIADGLMQRRQADLRAL